MRFEVTAQQQHREFEVVYRVGDHALAPVPRRPGSGFSLAFNEVQLELSEAGFADHVWGYCPKESWQAADLELPSASPGELRFIPGATLSPGAAIRVSKERLPVQYCARGGWLCIGNTSAAGEFHVLFAPGLIAVGTPDRIDALWIRIARFDA